VWWWCARGGGTVLDRWVIDPSADWDWNGAAAACVGDERQRPRVQ
jgi:hypothetical protein